MKNTKYFSAGIIFVLLGSASLICKANSQKAPHEDSKKMAQVKHKDDTRGLTTSVKKGSDTLAKKWSLKYLARASNSLLVINDQLVAKEKPICSIEKKQLRKLQQSLKIIIDQKIGSLKPEQVKDIIQTSETCEKSCSCDIFSYYFEKGTEHQHKSYAVLAGHKAKSTSSEDRLTCARSFKEFCKSDLMNALRK